MQKWFWPDIGLKPVHCVGDKTFEKNNKPFLANDTDKPVWKVLRLTIYY